jgi:microsomal dipeptidase-like Zn-dependent dipeptidase
MAFTDIHCHTFFKPNWMINESGRQELLAKDIDIEIDSEKKPKFKSWMLKIFGAKQFKEILNSQSSLKQVHEGKGEIIVINITALENAYANLGFVIFPNVFDFIKNIKSDNLKKIRDRQISYAEIVESEIQLINEFNGIDLNGFRYKVINRFDEVDNNEGVINVIVAIEGGHGFYQRNDVLEQEQHPEEVIEALIQWKRDSKIGLKPRLFYITPTHHASNCLANHAFAVPTGFAGTGINAMAGGFNPTEKGLTNSGKDFIRAALRENQDEDRILIDLKHLSFKSRQEFYSFRETLINEEGFRPFPILATHMGVTGVSWDYPIVKQCSALEFDDRCFLVNYNDSNGFKVTNFDENEFEHLQFNPWSINLYDEEIVKIIESKGLIGLSFDSRILGNEGIEQERFSKKEGRECLNSIRSIDFENKTEDNDYPFFNKIEDREEFQYPDDRFIERLNFQQPFKSKVTRDLLSLCQNVIHIIRVGGDDAWNRICVGSDYDGVINPIDIVPDASKMPNLEADFKKYIRLMARTLNNYIIDNDTGENSINVPNDFYEKFISGNANQFLAEHFN